MLTREQIAKEFGLDNDLDSDGNALSPGTGAEIQALEELLGTDFDIVFEPADPSPFCRCETCTPGDVTCIGGEDD